PSMRACSGTVPRPVNGSSTTSPGREYRRDRIIHGLGQRLPDLPGRLPEPLPNADLAGAGAAQADLMRVSLAYGTLVAAVQIQPDTLVHDLLAASGVPRDRVVPTFAAEAEPGKTAAVVGD